MAGRARAVVLQVQCDAQTSHLEGGTNEMDDNKSLHSMFGVGICVHGDEIDMAFYELQCVSCEASEILSV